jgi:phage terminase large subunit
MKDLIALTARGYTDGYRYIIHEGGTRSGKTHAILNSLYHITNAKSSVSSVVSETMPHLRKGAIRDYQRILSDQNAWDENQWNKTDSIHNIGPHKILEFFSADSPDKVHGPERDNLFLNEAQNISYDIARQLFVRTKRTVFIDFNPTREFWVHTELKNDPKTLWIHSTYKDNPYLTPEQVAEIERNRNKKTWWSIYGEGKIAESEGAVYTGWQIIDDIPHQARLERRGLDFGYTNDPTALVDVYYYNGGYILDERIYRTGMKNRQIADYLLAAENPSTIVVADSAEPKSIDEIAERGVPIIPANKGKDSVKHGIDYVQDLKISVTKRSVNLIKEYRNYLWDTDREGKTLNKPEQVDDHLMDALRYVLTSFKVVDDDDEEDDYKSGSVSRWLV